MARDPYENYQEYRPEREDETPQYPYQDYYNGGRKRRRSGGNWWILLVVMVVVIGVVSFFSRFTVELRRTANGYSFSIHDGRTAEPAALPEDDSAAEENAETAQPQQPPAAVIGTGTQLQVEETPQGAVTIPAAGRGMSLQQIYQKVIPSVVSITTVTPGGSSSGTGIIMSEDGYIITNSHVIDGAVSVEVLTSDDQVFEASLVGGDETSDLAVLKVPGKALVAAEFGNSDRIQVGDSVVAIGDPLGRELRGTMTDGIVSAINRDLNVNGRNMTLMQTNAALNNGNSGGPLINAYGQVIGINTMKMSSYYSAASVEGLGFAIPIATAKPIIDELIDRGYVSGRPAIGITGKELPGAARIYYGLPDGVYVETVDADSDAAKKGVRPGDMITAIEGEKITDMDALNVVKNRYEAGDTVELTIYRAGEYYKVDVVLMDAAAY